MNEKEALTRIKTENFNGGRGFDMQLLVNAVGIIGEMLKSGQISEVIRCKDCKYGYEGFLPDDNYYCSGYDQRHNKDWFCADGKRR